MGEEFNAMIDEVTDNINSVCKDMGALDRLAYIMVKKMVDRFGITPQEALEFWMSTAQEAYEFALSDESEE